MIPRILTLPDYLAGTDDPEKDTEVFGWDAAADEASLLAEEARYEARRVD